MLRVWLWTILTLRGAACAVLVIMLRSRTAETGGVAERMAGGLEDILNTSN